MIKIRNITYKRTILAIFTAFLISIFTSNAYATNINLHPENTFIVDFHQSGKLLAISFKSRDFKTAYLKVIDLSTQTIKYQKTFNGTVPYIPYIWKNYVVYHLTGNVVRLNLDTNEERTLPAYAMRITDDGYIIATDKIINIDTFQPTFSFDKDVLFPVLNIGDVILFSKKNQETHNLDCYEARSGSGQVLFSIPGSQYVDIEFPGNLQTKIKLFPLPILRKVSNQWRIEYIASDGKILKTYSMEDIGLGNLPAGTKPTNFGIKSSENGKIIYEIYKRVNNELKRFYIYTDTYGNLLGTQSRYEIAITGITPAGTFILLGQEIGNNDIYNFTAMATGQLMHQGVWRSMHPLFEGYPQLTILNNNEVLVNNGIGLYIKYAISSGEPTGLFTYPIEYSIEPLAVYGNYVFLYARSRYDSVEPPIPGTNLIAVDITQTGWLDIDLLPLQPNTGKPYETYDNTDVTLKFKSNFDFKEKLNVNVNGNYVTTIDAKNLEYSWRSFDLRIWNQPKMDYKVFASFGPVTKSWDITVIKFDNPLEFNLNQRVAGNIVWVEGTVKNITNREFNDLNWNVVCTVCNLKVLSSNFPNKIGPNQTSRIRVELGLNPDPYAIIPVWNGYTINQNPYIQVEYNYSLTPKNIFNYDITNKTTVSKNYSFHMNIYNSDTKNYLSINDINLQDIKIYTERLEDITKMLAITKEVSAIKINGVAPGIPGRPLKLKVAFKNHYGWIDLAFNDMITGFPNFVSPTLTLNAPTNCSLTVKTVEGINPAGGFKVQLTDKNSSSRIYEGITDTNGIYKFDGIVRSSYDLLVYKTGYIPYTNIVTIAEGEKKEISASLKPYIGLIFEANAYYKGYNSDNISTGFVKGVGLESASDHIFILPESVDKLYFKLIYKIGYPDSISASTFAADTYSVKMDIYEWNNKVFLSSESDSKGKGIYTFTEEDIYKYTQKSIGYGYQASNITRPTMFKVNLKAQNKSNDIIIWVFPSNWSNYKSVARQAALLYPLKGKSDIFSYGETAQTYLKQKNEFSNLMNDALAPIVNYGADALKIFGDVPDLNLKGLVELAADKITTEILVRIVAKLVGTIASEVTGELVDLFKSMIDAKDWGEQIYAVTGNGIAAINADDLLANMATEDINLTQSIRILKVVKQKAEGLISKFDANDPAQCQIIINDLKTIVIGPNPNSNTPSDYLINYSTYGIVDQTPGMTNDNYTLSLLLALELNNIQGWKAGTSAAQFFNDTIFPLSYGEKIAATKAAMATYEPIVKNLIRITSIIANICMIM